MAWERYCAVAKQYYVDYGDLLVNISDNTINGVALDRWSAQLRNCRKSNVTFPPELSYGEDAVFVLDYLRYGDTVDMSTYVGCSYRKRGKGSLSG